MKKTAIYFFIIIFLSGIGNSLCAAKVGFLIVATGRYNQYINSLIESAEKHFCKDHQVTYFIFTNGEVPKASNIVKIHQERLGWPYDSMMRFEMYYENKKLLKSQDYLYSCDADMLFVDTVGSEILGKRVATLHFGFVDRPGTYDTNPQSTACVYPGEEKNYFAGAFWGGQTKEFLKITQTIAKNIREDLNNEVIALWHDESHWNRYCIDHPPTVVLSPSYCYPDFWPLPYHPRLVTFIKDNQALRQ